MSGQLIERGLTKRWTTRRVADALRDSETAGVVSRRGGAIIGFALMLHDFPHSDAHLLLLAVEPGERRRGIGRALVEWLEKTARRGGILRFQLEVRADDPAALAFYQRLGYREVARLPGYYQGRLDAVRMARPVRP
jgi:ribosomal-protein-alanine N-acetyltransferase